MIEKDNNNKKDYLKKPDENAAENSANKGDSTKNEADIALEAETEDTAKANEEPFTDETAFNREFDPSHALFTHEEDHEDIVNEPAADTSPDLINDQNGNDSLKEALERSQELYADSMTFERMDFSVDKDQKYQKNDTVVTGVNIPKERKKSGFKKLSKATVITSLVAAAVVVLLTVIVLAANGLIPVFASEDVYGIFVDGKLVAAANSEEQINEAIDDFMSYYKTLEEQGSLTNLRFSHFYEIRELSRDEIKESIYNAKKGASSTAEVSQSANEEIENTTAGTTAATESESKDGSTKASETTAAETTTTTKTKPSRSTMAIETDASGKTIYPTTNKENPLNVIDGKIVVSKSIEDLQNVLFYGDVPEMYTVLDDDSLWKIADREGLTLTEVMVPNPDLLEDTTIGEGQVIKLVRMSGPMKLSFTREVTYTEDIDFKTVEQKTDSLYVGEKRISQQGKEGIKQAVIKYDYDDNRIAVKTPISEEVMEKPTDKIIQIGTKPKTSPNQSSNAKDASAATQTTSGGFMWPVSGARLSSTFGPRKSPKRGASSYHRGIDLAISSGTPIRAAQSGTVTIASRVGGYGNLVEINHGGGLTTRYGHCSVIKVKRGQKVNKGDVIALVGSTGVSTGPHLHFEVRKGGTAVNPLGYLK